MLPADDCEKQAPRLRSTSSPLDIEVERKCRPRSSVANHRAEKHLAFRAAQRPRRDRNEADQRNEAAMAGPGETLEFRGTCSTFALSGQQIDIHPDLPFHTH